MANVLRTASILALVDDDAFSANLLTRALMAAGAPEVAWLGDADQSMVHLDQLLTSGDDHRGGMIIVDLKASSSATRNFIAAIAQLASDADVAVIAMVPSDDRPTRSALFVAGASGVFVRHADRDAYRRQAAEIISFWMRAQRPIAVGM